MLPILFLCKSIIWFLIRKCLQISRLPAKEEAKRQLKLTIKTIFTNYKLGTCFDFLLQIVLPGQPMLLIQFFMQINYLVFDFEMYENS